MPLFALSSQSKLKKLISENIYMLKYVNKRGGPLIFHIVSDIPGL